MAQRAYIRLDPEFADRKEDYPDGAFASLIALFCAAAVHSRQGTFKSEKLVRVILGRRARWLKYLLEHSDVRRLDDGSLYIDGWEEWQEGNWKVAERMQRVRSKRNKGRHINRNKDRNSTSDKDNDYDKDNDGLGVTAPENAPMPLLALAPGLAPFARGRA